MLVANDVATFTFTIQNDSDLAVVLTPSVWTNTVAVREAGKDDVSLNASEWFEVDGYFGTSGTTTKTIDGNESAVYTVTVKLKKTPSLVTGQQLRGDFSIMIDAVSEDNVNS